MNEPSVIWVQHAILNSCRKSGMMVTVYLMNGLPLNGRIMAYDDKVLLLRKDGEQQMIYKHAISTVIPSQPIALRPAEQA